MSTSPTISNTLTKTTAAFHIRLAPPTRGDTWILSPDYVMENTPLGDWIDHCGPKHHSGDIELDHQSNGLSTHTHPNGWIITGQIHNNYYSWVLDFTAVHDKLGMVWGHINEDIYASSEEAWLDFSKNFPAETFCYDDI